MGCHINNIACCKWWLNIPSILFELSNAKASDSNNMDIFKKLALESVEIIKMFKKAVLNLEGIDFDIEAEYDYIQEKNNLKEIEMNSKNYNGKIFNKKNI